MSACAAGAPQISKLGQVSVTVHDLNRATAFYRDTLGLSFLFEAASHLAFFDCGGVRLMLSIPEPEFDHPSSILYFTVPDIAAAHSRLLAAGVHFEDSPHIVAPMPAYDLWMAFFRDSENNVLALMSEVPRKS